MSITAVAALVIAAFFGMTLACLEVGRALGRRARTRPRKELLGLGPVEGVIFALLGLLLALTFTSAASRFDARRGLIVEEANAIGTAWLRIDLLPEDAQPKLRENFRTYIDARIAAEHALPDVAAAQRAADEASTLQKEIWRGAVTACERSEPSAALLVLPAMNAMIDMAGTRAAAVRAHLPLPIYGFLCAISMVSALFVGYEMGRSAARSRLHTVVFAWLVTSTVYLIVDFEYPRFGVIHLHDADRPLVETRRDMN